jgi:hypothetical protein
MKPRDGDGFLCEDDEHLICPKQRSHQRSVDVTLKKCCGRQRGSSGTCFETRIGDGDLISLCDADSAFRILLYFTFAKETGGSQKSNFNWWKKSKVSLEEEGTQTRLSKELIEDDEYDDGKLI